MTDQPLISIDVVPLRFNRATRKAEVILGRRLFEPNLGQLALPGVLLGAGERLHEAVARALLTKVGVTNFQYTMAGDVGVFDNPDRDPRGPTLSITRFAVIGEHVELGELAVAVPLDEAHGLPFDHDHIISRAVRTVFEKLWTDKDTTEAFLGVRFTTLDAADAHDSLAASATPAGATMDRNNLTRALAKNSWVRELAPDEVPKTGRGRPAKVWQFL